jgi:predicted AAA+ superfamily ATPase
MILHRSQENRIHEDLSKKMVFLVGPRQVGKTWLSKKIGEYYKNTVYLNYDSISDREMIKDQSWLPETELVILDELHKMKNWKNYLKGLYDTKRPELKILVTGSARMETFRKSGDSLAGRFFVHHLLPLSLSELKEEKIPEKMSLLIERSGFPEPFLAETNEEAKRWRKFYTDSLVREDIMNFDNVSDWRALYDVFEILRHSVGAPISYVNIASDIGISPVTVKKYISALESLYIVFSIRTYTKKIKRSILKETKVYFYDTGLVIGDPGIIFENFVAVSLLKHLMLRNDLFGTNEQLMYLRTKEGKETDFALVNSENSLLSIMEVKLSDIKPSKNLIYFKDKYKTLALQIVRYFNKAGIKNNDLLILNAEKYLTELENKETDMVQ